MRLRYAINGIKRNLILTLLLIVQLVFAFYALYNTVDIKQKVHSESSKIADYFKGKKVYNLQNDYSDSMFNEDESKINEESLQKTFDIFRRFPQITFTHQVLFPILIETFEGNENFKFYQPENDFEGKKFFQAKNITLDKNALMEFDVKLKDGRFFNLNEIERNYADTNALPIIVGSNYEKYFKVGDEITYIRPDIGLSKAKIIGIMEENQYMPVDMMAFDFKRYADLNNFIITSYSQFQNYRIMYDTMFGYNFILFDENTSNETIEVLNNEIKNTFYDNLGIKVIIKDLNRYIKAELDTFKNQDKIASVTSITIFVFISLTLIISTLNSIYKRKKEFGIHIFSGGTIRDLAITIYLEVLLVLIFSFGISLLVIFYQNKEINLNSIKILFLNLIIISVVTTMLPIMKIFKLEINDIIKGAE